MKQSFCDAKEGRGVSGGSSGANDRRQSVCVSDREALELKNLHLHLGGVGDILADKDMHQLWLEFSADFSATFLIVDRGTVGNFAGWLIEKLLRLEKKHEKLEDKYNELVDNPRA